MHNADRWDAFANGIVREITNLPEEADTRRTALMLFAATTRKLPVLLAFNRTPVARKRKTMSEFSHARRNIFN